MFLCLNNNTHKGHHFLPLCFPYGKYRGSGCKPRGLEDSTEREKFQLTPSRYADFLSLTFTGAEMRPCLGQSPAFWIYLVLTLPCYYL